MPRICVFDVNETLLDLKALDHNFEHIFGDASFRKTWFSQFLQSALVTTVTNAYVDFGTIGMAALEMIAKRQKIKITKDDHEKIKEGIQHLPPYPEVKMSLELLRKRGLKLATLTNSTEKVATTQLTNAGLINYFEYVLSADTVKRLKPAAEPYYMAAKKFGVNIDRIRLVAAHSWDVAGALQAGCAAAFVARPGMVLDPLSPKPDIIGTNLHEVALHILNNEIS